jgi:hypothetical protein
MQHPVDMVPALVQRLAQGPDVLRTTRARPMTQRKTQRLNARPLASSQRRMRSLPHARLGSSGSSAATDQRDSRSPRSRGAAGIGAAAAVQLPQRSAFTTGARKPGACRSRRWSWRSLRVRAWGHPFRDRRYGAILDRRCRRRTWGSCAASTPSGHGAT